MPERMIADDEILLLRIPPTPPWLVLPEHITSANYKLGKQEKGLSVYRERIVSPGDVLNKPGVPPGCLLVWATAGKVRSLKNGKGEPLFLDVIAVDDENDPGHAEIRGRFSRSVAKSLSLLFRRV